MYFRHVARVYHVQGMHLIPDAAVAQPLRDAIQDRPDLIRFYERLKDKYFADGPSKEWTKPIWASASQAQSAGTPQNSPETPSISPTPIPLGQSEPSGDPAAQTPVATVPAASGD
jgi:hypothetical protein